jgi:N utilization substance protein B
MANRHLSRSVAMQSLFEWDFTGYPDAHLTAITARNINEFAPGIEDNAFILPYRCTKYTVRGKGGIRTHH